MAVMWSCECKAVNKSRDTICSRCGLERAKKTAPAATKLLRCPADGAAIRDGVCVRTGLFPMTEKCPFACPICRKPLEWSGACYQCHGTTSGKREDWEFPGDRYELEDAHWIMCEAGPRRACTPAENQAGARDLLRVLSGSTVAVTMPATQADEVPF